MRGAVDASGGIPNVALSTSLFSAQTTGFYCLMQNRYSKNLPLLRYLLCDRSLPLHHFQNIWPLPAA